jgi:hypothetical protein
MYVDSYEELVSMGREELTRLVYANKFFAVRGMSGMTKQQFWDLCNMFGGGCWTKEDYLVGKEQNFPIDDDGSTDRVFAFYTNHGNTAKAIGDAEMSWHVDIPLWPSHKAPLRAFYATSIPDNRYGITRFADRAHGWLAMTPEEQEEALKWDLLYQSWYEPGTNLTWLPVVDTSPVDGKPYLQFTSFSNSGKKHSHYAHGWKVHGWVFGARREGVPMNADYVSFLHEKTIVDDNIFENVWDEEDFVIYTNVHMIHDRTPLKSEIQTKPREFYRLNVFNSWQK